MHRLFVGYRPPSAIRAQLLASMGGVPGARWQSDDQLHLTLRFIGEIDRHVAEDVALALAGIRHSAIETALDGFGRFGSRGRTHALWAGLRPHAPLAELHRKIDQALVRCGLDPERRAYLPHITLARLNAPDTAAERFVESHSGLASAPFILDHFLLFESHLGREGARYDAVERYTLQQ